MSNRSDRVLLEDILEAAERAIDYCEDLTFEAFLKDTKTQDAVVRNIEIIGEATKGLSDSLRGENPDVPWKSVSGMRDRLIHDYFGVNWDIVWDVVQRDLPDLIRTVRRILEERNPPDSG